MGERKTNVLPVVRTMLRGKQQAMVRREEEGAESSEEGKHTGGGEEKTSLKRENRDEQTGKEEGMIKGGKGLGDGALVTEEHTQKERS